MHCYGVKIWALEKSIMFLKNDKRKKQNVSALYDGGVEVPGIFKDVFFFLTS